MTGGESVSISPETISLEWEEWQGDIPFWRHAVAGSTAGIAEHVAMFPLDTVKTRLQAYSNARSPLAFTGAVRAIFAERGFFGFLRGWTAIAGGCIPAHIALFSVYEHTKQVLSVDGSLSSSSAAICGASATLAHDLIITPMDVVKQRLQLGCYTGVAHCVSSLTRTEGIRALFRSVPTTLAMNAPYGAVFVAVNEGLKESLNKKLSLGEHFITAGVAAAIASVATHPLDVVKTRLQTQDVLCGSSSCSRMIGTAPKYPSFHVAVKTIMKEEGVGGFYRGLLPRTMLSVPAAATCWGMYETVKKALSHLD